MTGNAQLYQIAQAQRFLNRMLLVVFLEVLGSVGIVFALSGIYGFESTVTVLAILGLLLTTVTVLIVLLVAAIWLSMTLKLSLVWRILLIISFFKPGLNFLTVFLASFSATLTLRCSGIKVGVLGVSKETLEMLRPKPGVEIVSMQLPAGASPPPSL